MDKNNNESKVQIKYCGGCNPRYDRVKLAAEMEKAINDLGLDKDTLLIVCGCNVACAYKAYKKANGESPNVFKITSQEEKERILRLLVNK